MPCSKIRIALGNFQRKFGQIATNFDKNKEQISIFQEIIEEMIDMSVKSITDDTGCGRTGCLRWCFSVFLVFSL